MIMMVSLWLLCIIIINAGFVSFEQQHVFFGTLSKIFTILLIIKNNAKSDEF